MTAVSAEPFQLMASLEVGEGAGERLAAVLAAVPVASVVLKPAGDRPLTAASAGPLVALGQKAGAAMLIEGDTELARTLRADGIHVPVSETPTAALEAARSWLGGRAIVGVDAGRSRDDAMALGEGGADYVAFGIPAFVKERASAVELRLDLVAWWAEIFEVPVVAMDVGDIGEAADLAAAGADFVCLTLAGGVTAADAVAFVSDALAACRQAIADARDDGAVSDGSHA